MASSVSHEDLMTVATICSDVNIGQHHRYESMSSLEMYEQEHELTLSSRVWRVLNANYWNVITVVLVILEASITTAELLIDLNLIADPKWLPSKAADVSQNSSFVTPSRSARIQIAKDVLKYTSLVILIIFVFEIILKMASGREKFITKGLQVLDAIVVFATFGLDIAFINIPQEKRSAHKAALFIILIRLWKFKDIVRHFSDKTRKELFRIINSCKRDKALAENKVEFLILKVEDLEHEVAYLKENIKKAERGASTGVMEAMMTKDVFTQTSPKPQAKHVSPIPSFTYMETGQQQHQEEDKNVYEIFGGVKADEIVEQVYDELTMILVRQTPTRKPRRVPDRKGLNHSPESGYGSTASGFNPPERLSVVRPDELADKLFSDKDLGGDNGEVSLDEDTIAVLNELSEIDRIKRMSFDPQKQKQNLPVTAL